MAASIDSLVTGLQTQGHFVSGAVVFGREDQILFERGFGLTAVAVDVPLTPDTSTHIAPTTKTLTATLLFMLQADGRLRLGDFVAECRFGLPNRPRPELLTRACYMS
jgi:CubicO group peptidase (beta-lactamase class C family)